MTLVNAVETACSKTDLRSHSRNNTMQQLNRVMELPRSWERDMKGPIWSFFCHKRNCIRNKVYSSYVDAKFSTKQSANFPCLELKSALLCTAFLT
jgi:hypothetical protein